LTKVLTQCLDYLYKWKLSPLKENDYQTFITHSSPTDFFQFKNRTAKEWSQYIFDELDYVLNAFILITQQADSEYTNADTYYSLITLGTIIVTTIIIYHIYEYYRNQKQLWYHSIHER